MSDLNTAPADRQKVTEKREQVVGVTTQPLVVITEQQLAFSTAAAAPMPLAKPHLGAFAALRAMFRRSSSDAQPGPHHYPPLRDEFLESAAMEREMHRL